jgi:TonB family protein
MITYLLQVSFCWIMFYGIYYTILSRLTFFNTNRFYLLFSLLLGLVIPWIGPYIETIGQEQNLVVYFESVTYTIAKSSASYISVWKQPITYINIIYCIGAAIVSIKFLLGLFKIYKLYKDGDIERKKNYVLIHTNAIHLPFSFFNGIFLSKKLTLNDHVKEIILHEEVHINLWHSFDIILIEVFHIFFWFNPILMLYKKSLKSSHEYTADKVLLDHVSKEKYSMLLIEQTTSGIELALSNQFFNSFIKNRITMMNKKQSGKKALVWYLTAIPISIALLYGCSSCKEAENEVVSKESTKIEASEKSNIIKQIKAFAYQANGKNTTTDVLAKIELLISQNPSLSNEIISTFNETSIQSNGTISLLMDKNRAIKLNINEFSKPSSQAHIEFEILAKDFANEKFSSDYTIAKFKKIVAKNQVDFVELKNLFNAFAESKSKKCVLSGENIGSLEMNCNFKESAYKISTDAKPTIINCKGEKDPLECTMDRLQSDLIKHLHYSGSGKEGFVNLKFIVNESGIITQPETTEGFDKMAEIIVLRGFENIRYQYQWSPAKSKGKAVASEVNIPIYFASIDSKIPNSYKGKGGFILVNQKNEINMPSDQDPVYQVVQEKPTFPGGGDALLKFLTENIKYPLEAKNARIEGNVVIRFIIMKDGSIKKPEVLRSIGGGCDDEALRVVNEMNNMPIKWTPGKNDGRPVNVTYTLPVRFKLTSN